MSGKTHIQATGIGVIGLLLLSLANSFFLVTSQILFKIAVLEPYSSSFHWIWSIATNPMIVLSVICFIISSVSWWVILRNFDFSLAYPLVSLNYIFALAYASLLLKESITISRYIGVALIIGGVLLMALNEHRGNRQ